MVLFSETSKRKSPNNLLFILGLVFLFIHISKNRSGCLTSFGTKTATGSPTRPFSCFVPTPICVFRANNNDFEKLKYFRPAQFQIKEQINTLLISLYILDEGFTIIRTLNQ